MNAKEIINNLERYSEIVEKTSLKPSLYNTDYGYYLQQWSFEMHKMANELREFEYQFGSSNLIIVGGE